MQRQRITNEPLPRRGVSMFGNPLAGLLFGGVFVLAGILLVLAGARIIPIHSGGAPAPYWVLTAIGICFAAAGLFVQAMSVRQARRAAQLKRMHRQFPEQPWRADFPWKEDRWTLPRWKPVLHALGGTLFLALFSAPFNWIGFFSQRGRINWPFAVGACVMDLFVLGMVFYTCRKFLQTLKFGPTAIYWEPFPLFIGEPCRVQWQAPYAPLDPAGLKAKIRLIEEYFETTGSGQNRSTHLCMDCLYEQQLPLPETIHPGGRYPLTFTLPPELPSTALAADVSGKARPRYYALTIHCDQDGIDFNEHYLLPLYHREPLSGKP